MEVIYIILSSTLISGLFCFSFFFGFSLGLKQCKTANEEKAVEIKDEEEMKAYKSVQEWLNYTGQ